MDGHWADWIIRDREAQSDDQYARFPFSDNVHVRRLVDAYHCLGTLHFADHRVEAERRKLRMNANRAFRRMKETQISMVVAGGWNAGKSTVINAFLGERWMPMNVNRETVTVNRIMGGPERHLHVHFHDGHLPRQLRHAYPDVGYVHKKIRELGESHRDAIEHIDICYPGHPFLTWVALIDTPGLDFSDRDDRVSQPLIDDADVLIWVMHIEGPRQQDLSALRAYRRHNPGSRLLAVVNYADILDEGEWAEVQADKKNCLGKEADAVFLVSARKDLEARGSDPGFNQLRAYLNEDVLPAYGELRWRKPSRLAGECLAHIRDFAESCRHQPLKATNPFRLAGKECLAECLTARELAGAAGQCWDDALAELRGGHILRWLEEELKDRRLAQALGDLLGDSTLDDDARLLHLLALLAPGQPLVWRGISLEISALIELARNAWDNEADLATISQIYHRQVFRICANTGVAEYGDYGKIQDAWKDAFRHCEAVLSALAPKPRVLDDYYDQNRLLPYLLLLKLDQGTMRQKLAKLDLESLRTVPWYREIGDPNSDPWVLPLMLEFSAAAEQEYLWRQAELTNTSESYETFLERYPMGPFSEDARIAIPRLLRKELLKDLNNSFLRARYLKWRTRKQRDEDREIFCVWGIPLNTVKALLANQYGPLPDREITPANASRELLGK